MRGGWERGEEVEDLHSRPAVEPFAVGSKRPRVLVEVLGHVVAFI